MGFNPLSEEGRLALFRRYFPEVELKIEAAEGLAMLDSLTPGDFKAVFSRIRLNPFPEAVTIVLELELECAYRRQERRVGFNAD